MEKHTKDVPNIWSIVHKVVATDTLAFSTTLVEAKTKEKALKFYNEHVADGKWMFKAKLEDVTPLRIYSDKS